MQSWRGVDVVWFLGFAVASSVWCFTASREVGMTFDEPFYFLGGLDYWRTGSLHLLLESGTMPLPVQVQTLPIYLYEALSGQPVHFRTEVHEYLPICRTTNLAFWWLLLFYARLWSRALGGPWAGRFAVAFLAVDPNFLGHACLATTDISLTAMVLVAAYHFHRNRRCTWRGRVLLPGILFGLAMACKASALAYVPIIWVVSDLYRLGVEGCLGRRGDGVLLRLRRLREELQPLLRDWLLTGGIGLLTLILYCGSDWKSSPGFIAWVEDRPDGMVKDVMLSPANHLKIFPNALTALHFQMNHNANGHHETFLWNHSNSGPVWYYFPVSLSMKIPDGMLILLIVTLLISPRSLVNPACLFALALLAFSLSTRVQVGIRIVFPLVAFLYISPAVAIGRSSLPKRRLLTAFALLALLYSMITSWQQWPDGIRYINRLYGGSEQGGSLLADSNYDWGQGLPELRKWCEARQVQSLLVWQHTWFDPMTDAPPFRRFTGNDIPPPEPMAGCCGGLYLALNPDVKTSLRTIAGRDRLAVGRTVVNAPVERQPHIREFLKRLRMQKPVEQCGTFLIYDVSHW